MVTASTAGDSPNAATNRLLAHCAGVGRIVGEPRASARTRLARQLGAEFAQRLVGALVSDDHSGRRLSGPS